LSIRPLLDRRDHEGAGTRSRATGEDTDESDGSGQGEQGHGSRLLFEAEDFGEFAQDVREQEARLRARAEM
jgi:hypothetical protein